MNKCYYLSLAMPFLTFPIEMQAGKKYSLKNDAKPNIIFIISDEHKADVIGCYGNKVVKTPNIDALAKSGVTFAKAYTASPLSAPARAALITGTYPSTNGALTHRIKTSTKNQNPTVEAIPGSKGGSGKYRAGYKDGMITWGEYFKKGGYSNAAIGKMHVHGEIQKGVNPDYPNGNLMGFDVSDMRIYTYFPGGHYSDYKNNPDINSRYREIDSYFNLRKGNGTNKNLEPTLVQNEEDIFDFVVTRKSIDYIEDAVKANRPFVIHVGLEKPHRPWTTVQRFYDLYKTEDMILPTTWNDHRKNGKYPYVPLWNHSNLNDTMDIKRSMHAYYSCVSEIDEQVGKLIAKTKELGIYDNTIFVYTTDHGESLFEHGLFEKHCMFEPSVRVPLIISYPALLPQGVTTNSLASLVDILPTLAELTGEKLLKQWEGQSLVEVMKTGKIADRMIYSEFYEANKDDFKGKEVAQRMLLDNNYKYVYTHGMIDQLYDVKADINEMNNLALEQKSAALLERYRFLTLEKWNIKINRKMIAKIAQNDSKKRLEWEQVPEVKSYSVWKCTSQDATKAVKIAEVSENKFNIKENYSSFYWITANWDLTRLSTRSKTIPMLTQVLPEVLPTTMAIKL